MTPTTRVGQPWLEVVVPARNEATRLPAGLAELCAKAATLPDGVAIVVVDSASTDGTAAIVRRWPRGKVPVRLVTCERPGKGAAVRAGLLATTAPYVGFCDADMATDLSALDLAIELLAGGSAAVLGSRSHPDSTVQDRHSPVRRAGAAVFRAAARLVLPRVSDSQCGFKFFRGPLARAAAADMRSTGFAFDIELISRCRQLGAQPTEIPVSWRDVAGSRFSVWRHSLMAFTEVASIWLALRKPSVWPGPEPVRRSASVAPGIARRAQFPGGGTVSPAPDGAELDGSARVWPESA
jgi:dolichyl-phosphate beta-glucosyltransferase